MQRLVDQVKGVLRVVGDLQVLHLDLLHLALERREAAVDFLSANLCCISLGLRRIEVLPE